MSSLVPLRWSEGMFMRPHHLQQADLYQDGRLAYLLRVLNPFPWGVATLQVDTEALDNMIVRVLRCDLVFSDGLVVRYPGDAYLEERSFQDEFPPQANALGVFLGVRGVDPNRGTEGRFVAETRVRRDLLDRDSEAPLEFQLPKVEILFASEASSERLRGLVSIKAAEIRRTGRTSPRFELSPTYVPPALSLHVTAGLTGTVRDIVERLCAASRALGRHRRERGAEAIGYGVGDLEQLLARQVINQFVPSLQIALACEAFHPFLAYAKLAELRGALTSFFPDEEAWSFPQYDHEDLELCFRGLCDDIRRLLERLLPVHYLELTLRRDNFDFSTELDESAFARGRAYVLAIHGTVSEDELRRRVEFEAKLTSIPDMRALVTHALRGIPLRPAAVPPAEIPRYAGFTYFTIDTAHDLWAKVKSHSSLALHLPGAEPDMEARLFVVLAEHERARS